MSNRETGAPDESELSGDSPPSKEDAALDQLINEIGVARFASRMSAGMIDELAGYKAIARLVKADVHRPLFSKLGQALLRRPNSYDDE